VDFGLMKIRNLLVNKCWHQITNSKIEEASNSLISLSNAMPKEAKFRYFKFKDG
jgi:hypothetical protein